MKREDIILIGAFGFMQLALKDAGYEIRNGQCIVKKPSSEEEDLIKIYNWLGEHTKDQALNKGAEKVNEKVARLLNKEDTVNNLLLGLFLFQSYINELGNKAEQIMFSFKVQRVIDHIVSKVSKELYRSSYRAADNLWRSLNEKAQLSDNIRQLRLNRGRQSIGS